MSTAENESDPTSVDASSAVPGSTLEAALVSAAREGDDTAFEALLRLHQDRLFGVALRMIGHVQDAQDATQDALLQAWQHLPGFRHEAQFSTWITRILINRCHNLRRRPPPAAVPLRDEQDPTTVESVVESRTRQEVVTAAIAELPFDQKAALVLHTFDGRSQAEVARLLGTTETAVKVRIHRARRALLDRLTEWR